MTKPMYSYPYDQGVCSLCGVQIHISQQAIHDNLHSKMDELSEEIGILKATLSGLSSVAGPMGPPGVEGPAGRDAVGSEMFMKCPECMATVHVKDEVAHMEWHEMLDDLFEDTQLPMIEEDPSGPPPAAPTYLYPSTGISGTFGGGGGSVSSTSSGTYTINYGGTSATYTLLDN